MKLTFDEIIKATGADVTQRGASSVVASVSIDTRTIKAGDVFVAIRGPHFDGHEFINDAIEKGACGIVASGQWPVDSKAATWILRVKDTVQALGDIAHAWRRKTFSKVVAVTGSNGKSTTKEMIAQGLMRTKRVVKTEGNFNNLIGLPLQVMRILPEHEVAVLEMGMNAEGEIRRLAKITDPDIGIITNVNPAHLELLHTVENVAKAKGELFETMKKGSIIVVNMEDPLVVRLAGSFEGKKVGFGMQDGCDVRFGRLISEGLSESHLVFYAGGKEYSMRLPIPGVHNVMNALAALAAGMALSVDPKDMIGGLEAFVPMKMRMERVQLLNGVQVVNDSYNANPSSMQAAFRTVSSVKRAGRFIAVVGDMLELGDAAGREHFELGAVAAVSGASKLFVAGSFAQDVLKGAESKGMKPQDIMTVKDSASLKEAVLKEIRTGDVVLVKGSRGMKMEVIVEYLKNEIGT
jgi:UDP-N-acetylmuramoyl-tripeptide--D-alanyl-D-alanine ligase